MTGIVIAIGLTYVARDRQNQQQISATNQHDIFNIYEGSD